MGNTIIPLGNGGDEGTSLWMKVARIAIDEEHFRKVDNAKDISLALGLAPCRNLLQLVACLSLT